MAPYKQKPSFSVLEKDSAITSFQISVEQAQLVARIQFRNQAYYSHALATAGSVMNNGCLQSQFDERERESMGERAWERAWEREQTFGLQRPQSFSAIPAQPAFFYPLTQENRKRLCSVAERVNRQKQCHILIWDLFTIPSPTSFNICCLIIGIRFCSLFN